MAAKDAVQFNNKYRYIEELGFGGFGAVYRVSERSTGKEYAVKVVAKNDSSFGRKSVEREIAMQKDTLNHPNVVKYFDCWEENYINFPETIKSDLKRLKCFHGQPYKLWKDHLIPFSPKYCMCMSMKIYDGKIAADCNHSFNSQSFR